MQRLQDQETPLKQLEPQIRAFLERYLPVAQRKVAQKNYRTAYSLFSKLRSFVSHTLETAFLGCQCDEFDIISIRLHLNLSEPNPIEAILLPLLRREVELRHVPFPPEYVAQISFAEELLQHLVNFLNNLAVLQSLKNETSFALSLLQTALKVRLDHLNSLSGWAQVATLSSNIAFLLKS